MGPFWLAAATFTYTYTDNHTPGYNASISLLSPSIAAGAKQRRMPEVFPGKFRGPGGGGEGSGGGKRGGGL